MLTLRTMSYFLSDSKMILIFVHSQLTFFQILRTLPNLPDASILRIHDEKLFHFIGGRILIPLPNTRYAFRRKNSICARFAVGIFVICFGLSQLYVLNQSKYIDMYNLLLIHTESRSIIYYLFTAEKNSNTVVEVNYSAAAILSMVPSIYHKYLTTKTRNQSYGNCRFENLNYSKIKVKYKCSVSVFSCKWDISIRLHGISSTRHRANENVHTTIQ